jgi:hypothetical protein
MVCHCGDLNLIPKPVYVGFVVDKEALGQVFLPLLLLSPVLLHSSVIDYIILVTTVFLTLPPSCAIVMKSGNLNFLEPFGPLQACSRTALQYS